MEERCVRSSLGFNEAGAWEPRMLAPRPQDADGLARFNEAGAWEPRMPSHPFCWSRPDRRFNEAGAWEPRMLTGMAIPLVVSEELQ